MLRKRPRKRALAPEDAADPEAAGRTAVALLSRRDYCAGELGQTLRTRGFSEEVVEQALDEALERGFVNDARYAERYVSAHAERGNGPLRIRRELIDRGVSASLVEAALSSGEDWAVRARALRVRRFGPEIPSDWAGRARQARFLQYRGFSNDHIRAALGNEAIEDLT